MLPRSIRIGAHNYAIKNATRKELGKGIQGDMDPSENVIRVIKHASVTRKIELLLHEVLHAMLSGHEFEDEEHIVCILGESITQFLADNPAFVTEALRILSEEKNFLMAVDNARRKTYDEHEDAAKGAAVDRTGG